MIRHLVSIPVALVATCGLLTASTASADLASAAAVSLGIATVADYDYGDYLDDLEDAREDYFDDLEDYYEDINRQRRRAFRRGYHIRPYTTYVQPPIYSAPVYSAPIYTSPVYRSSYYHSAPVYRSSTIYSYPTYSYPTYRTYQPFNRGHVQVGRFGFSF